MADVFTPRQRSAVMRAVRDRNTTPEVVVGRLLRRLGLRPQLHVAALPGSPDFVFARRKIAVFVHGCFWHRHACEAGESLPASNQEYWLAKFARNRCRDARCRRELRKAGWQVLTVWECQTRAARQAALAARLARVLQPSAALRGRRPR